MNLMSTEGKECKARNGTLQQYLCAVMAVEAQYWSTAIRHREGENAAKVNPQSSQMTHISYATPSNPTRRIEGNGVAILKGNVQ